MFSSYLCYQKTIRQLSLQSIIFPCSVRQLCRNARRLIDVMLNKAQHLAFSSAISRDSSPAAQNDTRTEPPQEGI
jgi:hypothetical protein